jgi:hypothetical protein
MQRIHKLIAMVGALLFVSFASPTLATDRFVSFQAAGSDGLSIIKKNQPLPIVRSTADAEGIAIAVESLSQDFQRVCGTAAPILDAPAAQPCILVGSLASPLIRQLADNGKIDASQLEGKREKYLLQVVKKPMAGVDRALVIAGSDKRGTIYGIYELSRQMGVSPWYWWMDVPTTPRSEVSVLKGVYTDGEPQVEYRGIFINDEHPCAARWASEKFGGFNSQFYAKVFELLLRLKANFMWPAMWANAFFDDDPGNGPLADRMGIVMGTSHHEPMNLAQQDWKRRGQGAWNFESNAEGLSAFWRTGIERSKNWETLVTVGMRGDGDMAMDGDENIALMEHIVDSQRSIIADVTGRKAEETPQVWALYKEIQDYYDHGMKVPDDVTLLLCDDNWGNVRRLPELDAPSRKGGFGMYYHFDYVGGPRNSKWINISPIPRVWEQMNLTYAYGVRKLWIVNVGDLKPMEYPITFFLDMAWAPERFTPDMLADHTLAFCRAAFGDAQAGDIARLLRTYPKYNRRVTPELLNADTYTFNYDEWPRVRAEYEALADEATRVRALLPEESLPAYDQLIAYPIWACANLYDMYYAQAKNKVLAKKQDPEANAWADEVERCFARDTELTAYYHQINNGKWNHLMDQVHIGYKSWNNPEEAAMPAVTRVEGTPAAGVVANDKARYAALGKGALNGYATDSKAKGFAFKDNGGHVSIEAEHYTRVGGKAKAAWAIVPELGQNLSGFTTLPADASPEGLYAEYDFTTEFKGEVKVTVRCAPTLNFHPAGLRYAISLDGGEETVVNINGDYDGSLGKIQREHLIYKLTRLPLGEGKTHTLRIRPLDAGLVIENILINTGELQKTYLGAPETLAD